MDDRELHTNTYNNIFVATQSESYRQGISQRSSYRQGRLYCAMVISSATHLSKFQICILFSRKFFKNGLPFWRCGLVNLGQLAEREQAIHQQHPARHAESTHHRAELHVLRYVDVANTHAHTQSTLHLNPRLGLHHGWRRHAEESSVDG